MNIIRNAISEIQLKYKISKAISEATNNSKLHVKTSDAGEVISLAADHPQYVLQGIYDRLMYDGYISSTTFLSIELLEIVVNNSSYAFHCVLADYGHLRNRLVELACIGGDNATCRAVKGAARRLVLEFSRMFADDERLTLLSRLADRVELQSGRKLLRSILLEKKRVKIRSPREGDYVMIDPIERPEGHSPRLPPSPIWTCQPCRFVNKSKHLRCIVCGSMKPRPQPPQQQQQPKQPPAAAVAKQQQKSPEAKAQPSPTAAPAAAPKHVDPTTDAPAAAVVTATSAEEKTNDIAPALTSSGAVHSEQPRKDDDVTPAASAAETSATEKKEETATAEEQTTTTADVTETSPETTATADNDNAEATATTTEDETVQNNDDVEEAATTSASLLPGAAKPWEKEIPTAPVNLDDEEAEDAAVESIVERAASKEPLQNTHYVDSDGVHHLVEAEDVLAIRAALHHNAEVEEARIRRNSVMLEGSVNSAAEEGEVEATDDAPAAVPETTAAEEEVSAPVGEEPAAAEEVAPTASEEESKAEEVVSAKADEGEKKKEASSEVVEETA